jgi:hypothetical protein
MRKEVSSKEELLRWLKSTTSAVLLTITLSGGVQELQIQSSSARALVNITQSSPEYFVEGPYVINYEESENDSEEVPYTDIATAFTFKGHLAQHPERSIGGMDALRNELSGFEYTAKIKSEAAGLIGHLLIVIPESPNELEKLKLILHTLSVTYIFPDGTGTINENNLKMGKGLMV